MKYCLGKVWNLIGVPKIGKTLALLQLNECWIGKNVHWYDCPYDDGCVKAIATDLMLILFQTNEPEKYLSSEMLLDEALKDAKDIVIPSIFVIDNADNLSERGSRQLASIILKIKRHGLMGNLGFIFASNKKLNVLAASTDESIVAPSWKSKEIDELLIASQIRPDSKNPNGHLELLERFSGGHPLYAIALARKYPTTQDLLWGNLQSVPEPSDENLSREIQELLYDDILTDPDSQNLVQRLSILTGQTQEDILEVLRTEITPPNFASSQSDNRSSRGICHRR